MGINIKSKIIIGCLLSVFILIMLPSIPSIECNNIKKSNNDYILNSINNLFDTIREKIPNIFYNKNNVKSENLVINSFFVNQLKSNNYDDQFKGNLLFLFRELKDCLFGGLRLMGFAVLLFLILFVITAFMPLFIFIFSSIDDVIIWFGYIFLLIFIIIFFIPGLILFILAQIIVIIFNDLFDLFNEPDGS